MTIPLGLFDNLIQAGQAGATDPAVPTPAASPAAAYAAIPAAGVGSMALSQFAQDQVSPKLGTTAGNIASYIATPIGAQLNSVYKALGGGNPFGAGKTSHQQGAYNAGTNADSMINEILQRIQSKAGVGTFNEGQIGQAEQEVKNLQDQLNSGKISQADYVKITDAFLPQITQYAHQMASTGSAGAKAVQAGMLNLDNLSKEQQIYKAGQTYLGRDLTPAEIAQIKPKFADGADIGNAYVAELAKQEASSPEALGKKAGQYSGDVNQIFQDLLARGASKDELDYFGRALASGQTTAYQLKQYVQSLPEYQNQQDTQFRQGLQGELSKYDTEAFDRERQNILSGYRKAGIENSSSLDFAITDALSKMQTNRDQFLAGLSSQQYGGNKSAALDTYKQSQNQYLNNLDYQRNLGQSNLNYLTGRADQGADYTRQMQDYLNFAQNQPKKSGPSFLDYAVQGTQAAAPWAYLYA